MKPFSKGELLFAVDALMFFSKRSHVAHEDVAKWLPSRTLVVVLEVGRIRGSRFTKVLSCEGIGEIHHESLESE